MSKPAVLLDLDYTLLDGAGIKKSIFAAALKDTSFSAALRRYKKSKRSGLFSLAAFAGFLGLGRSGKELKELYALFRKAKLYNYPGAETFLKTLRAGGCDLYLISYGDRAFQQMKIRQSGLAGYFKQVLITQEISKEKELRRLGKKSVHPAMLLDDSPLAIAAAKRLGFAALRLKRGAKDERYYSRLLPRINKILGMGLRMI